MADSLTHSQRRLLDKLAAVQVEISACERATQANLAARLALVERALGTGLSLREVAAAIGVREGTLGQARHKARKVVAG